jgi:uncharacterized protein YjbJ (UPF0337 family)
MRAKPHVAGLVLVRMACEPPTTMDKDRMEAAGHQAKDAAGKALDDKRMQTEGKTEKAAGELRNAVGGAKDAARQTAKEWDNRKRNGRAVLA